MLIAFGLALVCALLVMPGRRRKAKTEPLFRGTGGQWRRNYSRRSFLRLGGGLLAAGLLAYSGADEAIERWHTGSVRSSGTDVLAGVFKFFGERFWFGLWFMTAAADAWIRSGPFSRWARSNFEAMTVGLPVLWTVQRGLGANRPSSDDGSPRWRPMKAANSASGHTFIAAIPWMNLARSTGLKAVQIPAWLGSAVTGWSRMNDQKHYLSQVLLGWLIAWNAVAAVQLAPENSQLPGPAKGSE